MRPIRETENRMDGEFAKTATHWRAALPPESCAQWIAGHCLIRLPGNEPPGERRVVGE